MSALRCAACKIDWPNRSEFLHCVRCKQSTHLWCYADPIGESAVNHHLFERWLDEHGRRGPVETLERIPTQDEQQEAA